MDRGTGALRGGTGGDGETGAAVCVSAYYNEIDAKAAAWLRELIRRNLIAPGDVDERSIADVRFDDLRGYTQCHFFAGIGVWSYALRRAGWADDEPVWTGSCPCQPFSAFGKGAGYADERHLWPHWHRLIGECRPATIFGEQVDAAIRTGWLDDVCLSLESLGYAVGAVDFPACSVGAPHIRQRVYFVADRTRSGQLRAAQREDDGADRDGRRRPDAWDGGNARAVAESEHAERWQERGPVKDECDWHDAGWTKAHGIAGACGEVRSVADAGWRSIRSGRSALAGAAGGMQGEGLQRERIRTDAWDGGNARAVSDPWSDAIWLPCRDGKARPTQPGVEPLAHGTTARVVRLRGYGNAIVAEQARAFIEAYLEARRTA